MIDIVRQDIGEGWWEGSLNGVSGLLPASCEQLASGHIMSIPSTRIAKSLAMAMLLSHEEEEEEGGGGGLDAG